MTEKVKIKTKEPSPKDSGDELERELKDSFPASDPPSITQNDVKAGDPQRQPRPARKN
ncbi:hypothetical protein [Methylocapsa palsarum]|uniref:Uncharacterized protein n=1 Tax=Methylocapsa palsarum TaxID=1612308 RepID=A0A1I4BJD5_9HYPH|nr:hypothetical protein [Methylocapsa palsarum]SFK68944.1 hypothetical protein SAMN05444581_11547 [Methylocapsa palsarum]